MLSLMPLVKIVVLLLRVSYGHKSLFVAPFLDASVEQSTEWSFIFVNPEEYQCDTREFIIIFHAPLTLPFFMSLPDSPVGTVLGKHVHRPPITITSRKNNRRYSELQLITTLFFKSH